MPCFKHGTSRGRGSHFLTVIKNSKNFGRAPSSRGLLVKQNGVWVGTLRPGTETSLLAQDGSWVAFREQCPRRRSREQRLCQKPRRRVLRVEQLMLAAKVLGPSAGTHRHTTASMAGGPFRKKEWAAVLTHALSAPPLPGPGSTPVLVGDRPTPQGQDAEETAPVCCRRAGKGCSGLSSA